jgi:hypothetical protein
MKSLKFFTLQSILCFANLFITNAQTPKDTIIYRIETSDGNEYFGNILSKDSVKVNVNTEKLGILSISQKDIVRISPASKGSGGQYWIENPQATRYFISGNAYGLKAGEAYYQNTWVLFNQVNMGVTNNFSLGFGLMPTFLLGAEGTPAWITPKLSLPIQKNKINISIGAFMGKILGADNNNFGFLNGLITYGSRDRNVSFGLGYGYSDDGWAKHPLISLNALYRTGPKGYIITENYFFDDGNTTEIFLSIGGRRMIKRVGLDYGFFIPVNKYIDQFIAIPWLGLIIPLSKQ